MKEPSMEEKSKRYDEALEKARQLCDYPTSKPFISDLQDMFTELKESEAEKDARINKRLIECLKGNMPDNEYRREYISWLEKQGEQKTTWKPTEEQIEALEHLLETIRRHEYSYFHEEKFLSLHSLLEQLKEL